MSTPIKYHNGTEWVIVDAGAIIDEQGNRVGATEARSHLDDLIKHITSEERLTWNGKINSTEKGTPNGVATLDGSGVLAQKPYVTGTYTGNGASSRTINLGFTPSAVYVTNNQGITKDGTVHYGGLATNGFSLKAYSDDQVFDVLKVTTGGFIVYYAEDTNATYIDNYRYVRTNSNSVTMTYIAWR